MSKPLVFSALTQFVAATAGRNMTKAAYAAIVIGVLTMVLLSVDPAYEAAHRWVDARAVGVPGLLRVRMAGPAPPRRAATPRLLSALPPRTGGHRRRARGSAGACCSASAGANRMAACGAMAAQVIPGVPGLRQLRRVLVLESGPLLSVLVFFLMVLFLASVAVYFFERDVQPATFGNVPAALWWAVVTLTTTGYGDVVPITPLGRMVAALVMISGLGVFGCGPVFSPPALPPKPAATISSRPGSRSARCRSSPRSGPSAIADVTHMLRTIDLPPRTTIIRKGQHGDCMYFIASGEVEVDLPGKKVRLGEGAFFGEMALLGNNLRTANITTTRLSKLLVLDLVDFRLLMARHPDLAETIDAEAKRRALENK